MVKKPLSIFTLSLVTIFVMMVSCSDQNSTDEIKAVPSEKEKKEKIAHIELLHQNAMNANSKEEAKKASEELLISCMAFVESFPKDPNCAEFTFMAAKAANGLQKYDQSLLLLERITKVYPDYENIIEVYFLYAFTLDEDLNEKDKAKIAYTKLINKFPGEPLAKQAEALMSQLYLSDEELIEKLMEDTQSN